MSAEKSDPVPPPTLTVMLGEFLKELRRGEALCKKSKDSVGEKQHQFAWSDIFRTVGKFKADDWDYAAGVRKDPPKPIICQLAELLERWKETAEQYEAGVNEDCALWVRAIGQALHDAVSDWMRAMGMARSPESEVRP